MPKRTIIITGTTSGIGAKTAIELARQGNSIYMLVRDVEKGEREKRNILVQGHSADVHIIKCDLADLKSVRNAVNELKAKLSSVEVLINNAGGIFPARQLSNDGFEMTFALNHLGHFLLTLGLMPLLEKGRGRIINLSSEAHKAASVNIDDLQSERSYQSITAYGNAKLYNIYLAQLLAEKFADKGITAYSLHPGIVNTQFGNKYGGFLKWLLKMGRPFMISAGEGAETPVYLAVEPGIEQFSGKYFKKKRVARTSVMAQNEEMREQLWTKSMAMVKPYL